MTLDDLFNEPQQRAAIIERPPPRPREGATVIVPVGWQIDFCTKPYRHYKVDGVKVVSTTQVTGCLDKPALPWWGMKTGVAGVIELVRRDVVPASGIANAETQSLVDLLTQEKLTTNHVKREAADRGSRVHDAMEDWANNPGVLPDPAGLPEDEQGYIHGLRAFILDTNPQPDGVEMIVGSKQYAWAGRGDLLNCTIPEPVIATVAIDYKTGKETRSIIPAGAYLLDLKTSSGVWKEHHFQVAGYQGGSLECGYPPVDRAAILRVTVDGKYELVEAVATYEDFLAVKQAFDATKRIEKRAA